MKAKQKNLKYKPAWRWLPIKEDLLNKYLESPSLHVCCGMSKIGDVRLDLHTESDIRGDMRHLPFRDQYFKTTVCDPPWRMPYHLRPMLLWELRRTLQVGGKLIIRSPWSPRIPRMKISEVFVNVPTAFWANLDIYTVYTRNQDIMDNHIKEAYK